jgi:DNA polymerase III subunit chi
MTDISFHFNVTDKLLHTCRLLRKAQAGGASVAVTADAAELDQLDQLLWSFSATDFVPHLRAINGPAAMIDRSVLLVESPASCPHHGVLVNLGLKVPDEFERFERFIEVVTLGSEERLAARDRWKHYSLRGYALQKHDLAAVGQGA